MFKLKIWISLLCVFAGVAAGVCGAPRFAQAAEPELRTRIDAPLLFVKRHSYTGIHIYDTFYKWPPGGGGIHVLENPSAPRAEWTIRAVIDPATPQTLGVGVYSHPELSWDATKLLFCFKGEPQGSTSIFEIGIDGKNLRRVTDPSPGCADYRGAGQGQHDIAPGYLPDGRIVFLSTRRNGLVPCNNTGVAILHVMNPDGSDIHLISVNNVNEFDPAVLADGRILFGRWEYVDKNALTIQSLWTINPDGTQETALFANNMVFPEAILDARPVPGSHWVVGTFAKHNGPPRGSIAFIDPRLGKNEPRAITNLEHPTQPTFDLGNSCEPWPLSDEVVLFSGRPAGHSRNVIEMMDRAGRRETLLSDAETCLHSPMLVKPRPRPPALVDATDRHQSSGRFFVQDIYQGLSGVNPGEVKWLRVLEETSRVSGSPGSPDPYNQTFLVSTALAFSAKNYLGVVPVDESGSAYFEAPAGRALYFQALDGEGRLVQSMRSFVQAAPGTTRSCIGCHEHKSSAVPNTAILPAHKPEGRASLSPASRVGRVPSTSSGSPGRTRPTGFKGRVHGSETRQALPEPTPSPLPGGELESGAENEASLLGEARGGFSELEAKHSSVGQDGPTLPVDRAPSRLQPESWGSGSVDYPSRIQPILDRRCVSCHGGEKGIAAGMDLSGGWTEHFNISYENLANRRETQLIAYWIAGIDCMNGTALWSAQIFPPRSHGSGAAPLADLLVRGHEGRLPDLTRPERDLLMAWIDSNGLYYGTWDYTQHGYTIKEWGRIRDAVIGEMKEAGCLRCHGDGQRPSYFENAWLNLKEPRLSCILRAPLPKDADGFGLGSCRDRAVDPRRQRIHLLWNGYAHAVLPPEKFPKHPVILPNPEGEPILTFASTNDPHYQKMLAIIEVARVQVLASPRVDMPGAQPIRGACREVVPTGLSKRSF